MPVDLFFIYAVTVFIASIVPGPSMLLALTHGMQYGAKRTIASALGNLTVTLIQAAISIGGLGVVLLASHNIFNLIKWAGAAYLAYIGLKIWCSQPLAVAMIGEKGTQSVKPLHRMYLQAALVTAGNPKAIVFFTAVFPQFIDPKAPCFPQFGVLMSAGAIIGFSCFMLYAVGGQKIVDVFSTAALGKYLNKIVGGSFIGAGIGLAATNR